jgi:hypothetical protein
MQTEDTHLAEIGQAPAKPNIAGELIIPVLGVLFTIYYIVTVLDSPWTAQVNAFMVGSLLILTALIFFIKKIHALWVGVAILEIPSLAVSNAMRSNQLRFTLLILAYLGVLEVFGFVLATVLFFFLSMCMLDAGRRPFLKLSIAIFLSLIGYVVFISMFQTRLPKGPIEAMLAGLV